MTLQDLIQKLKDKWMKRGYTCDFCAKEAFRYPFPRLCDDCDKAFLRNDKFSCAKCGRATVTEGVCLLCKTTFPLFDLALSPYVYHSEVAGAINLFKRGKSYLSYLFGEQMTERIKQSEIHLTNAVVTYVPLDVDKKRTRGYDQAELLARVIATQLNLPLIRTLYSKVKTEQQKELSVKERAKNAAALYRLVNKNQVAGKTVLLVDDVMTTGATGSECALKLTAGGAYRVYFITAAALPERR